MKNKLIIIITTFIIVKIIYNYNLINLCIQNSCYLFIKKIFPSMFLSILISTIIIELDIAKYINLLFSKFNKYILKININTSYILLLSILSGCPGNAKIAKDLYEKKIISKKNIQKIILYSHFINPFFIINNIKYNTLMIIIAHYISNIIIGIIFRNKYNDKYNNKIIKKNKKLHNIIFDSINSSINTCLFVLGTIITFNIISTSLNNDILNILLELSNGINYINNCDLSIKFKTILCGSILSFGGLCIHMQVYGILSKLNIKYIPYLLSRILHSIITAIILNFMIK